jgi:hypothetical protein
MAIFRPNGAAPWEAVVDLDEVVILWLVKGQCVILGDVFA